MAPSAPPAPTSVCSSSMKRMTFLACGTSFMTALMRSSNWPRYLVPATIMARSRMTMRAVVGRISGTLPSTIVLGQALDDGGLADAGLAEQHGVVLGAAAEDLDDALDLVCAADDRVELAFAGQLGQVAAEGVQRRRLALAACRRLGALGRRSRLLRPRTSAPSRLRTSSRTSSSLSAEVHQHLGGDAFLLAQQAQEQVLGADVVVVEAAGLLDGVLDDLLGARGVGELAHGDHVGAALDDLLDLEADLLRGRRRGSSARWRRRRCLP